MNRPRRSYYNGGNNEDGVSVSSGIINMRAVSSIPRMILIFFYNSLDNCVDTMHCQTLMFQVINWRFDVKNDSVSMKFRVTLFCNDVPQDASNNNSAAHTINEIGNKRGPITRIKS